MSNFTYSSLAAEMRADLASGGWKLKSYEFDGTKREFHSLSEIVNFLRYVENQAAAEQGGGLSRVRLAGANR